MAILFSKRENVKKMSKAGNKKNILLGMKIAVAVFLAAITGIALAGYQMTQYNPFTMFTNQNPYAIQQQRNLSELKTVYNGTKYRYNSDIVSVLFLGIDRTTQRGGRQINQNGYQADTLMVAAMNTKTRDITLINIPRDTVTDVMKFDGMGEYAAKTPSPICTAHSFGDGDVTSGQMTEAAVSNLLYGIPVNCFISMDIDGIDKAAGLVGGVPVEIIEDMTMIDPEMKKGETFVLDENTAENYVRDRQLPGMSGLNTDRMKRQMQFSEAFLDVFRKRITQDKSFAIMFLKEMRPYISMDMSPRELIYAVCSLLEGKDKMQVIALKGEKMEEGYFLDEKELKDMVIKTYFIPA